MSDIAKIEPEEEVFSNPWDVKTLYQFQFFNCPECFFKVQEKQEFINHAYQSHPDCIDYLESVKDGSLTDVDIPWTSDVKDCVVKLERLDESVVDPKTQPIEDQDYDYEPEFGDSYLPEIELNDEDVSDIEDSDDDDEEDEPLIKRQRISGPDRDPESEVQCFCCGKMVLHRNIRNHLIHTHGSYSMRMYGDPRPFQCLICSCTCVSQHALDVHICYDIKVPDRNKETKTYNCTQCSKQCRTPRNYRQHFLSAHREERPFGCPSKVGCELRFKHNYAVRKHVQMHHSKDNKTTHLCQECGNTFANEERLKMHVALIHEKKPINEAMMAGKEHICPDCGKPFANPYSLKEHQRKTHNQDSKTLNCFDCDQEFEVVEEYDQHVQECHPDAPNLGKYNCEQCDMNFCHTKILDWHYLKVHNESRTTCHLCMKALSHRTSLNLHIQRVHNPTKPTDSRKRYGQCVFCDKWDGETPLKDHIKTFHSNEEMPFACDQCDYRTFKVTTLNQHIKKQHSKKEQYFCDQCEFVTAYKAGLQRHIDHVHLQVKAFQCHMCPKALKDRRTLQRHLVTKHQLVLGTKEMEQVNRDLNKPHLVKPVEAKCDTCDLLFDTEEAFEEHFKKCHKNMTDIKFKCNKCDSTWEAAKTLHFHLYNTHNAKDGPCDICGKVLADSYHIERHKETVHFNIRKFKCDQCHKCFSLKAAMENHIKAIHIKIPTVFCEQCDYKTTTKKLLSAHFRMHHIKDYYKCNQCDFATNSPKILKTHKRKTHH